MTKLYTGLLLGGCLACGAPLAERAKAPKHVGLPARTPAPTAAQPPERLPSLSTFFQARTADGTVRPLVSGDSLRSGDHFWLELVAREKLFVWVLYAGPDGSAAVLYPTRGEVTLAPLRPQRVPEAQDFELDENAGWERLLVVASRARLDSSRSQLGKLVEHVRVAHQWPSDITPPEETDKTEEIEKKASVTEPARPPQREGTRPAVASSQARYGGPTPNLEPRVAGADTRGLTRGIKLVETNSGRLDFQPDEDGVVAIPLFLKHEPRRSAF